MPKIGCVVIAAFILVYILEIKAGSLPEPFLLPFGPDHNDTFNNKEPKSCSFPQNISRTFKLGPHRHSSLHVCMRGIVTFGEPVTSDPVDFANLETPVIAPLFSDILTNDNFLDQMCVDGSAEFLYQDLQYEQERVCWFYWNYENDSIIDYLDFKTDYIQIESLESKILAFEDRSFRRGDMDMQYDDYITVQMMGEKTIKYPNLGNNIMKREMSGSDLEIVNNLTSSKYPGIHMGWGYVATWYKVSPHPGRLDSFNSFQTSIFCSDEGDNGMPDDDRCFCLLDFYQIQWRYTRWDPNTFARSGINDGNGTLLELPFSGTQEVLNLWALTNIGIPGLFLYEISQTDGPTTITPAGNFEDFDVTAEAVNCPAPILPAVSQSGSSFEYTILDCALPLHTNLEIRVVGQQKESQFTATYSHSRKEISSQIVWYDSELVSILIVIDGVLLDEIKAIFFYDPNDRKEVRTVVREGGIVSVELFEEERDGTLCVDEKTVEGSTGHGPPARIPSDGRLNMNYTIENNGSLTFVRFHLCGRRYSRPVRVESLDTLHASDCHDWDEKESEKDYSDCIKGFQRTYACPRHRNRWELKYENYENQKMYTYRTRSDVWWARQELASGINGWKYDMCCNKASSLREQREELHNLGYCNKDECEFNPGADFCIVSPRYACRERNSGKVLYASNQCCYDSAGRVMHPSNSYGPGTMKIQLSSLSNMIPYYQSDIRPYLACTLVGPPTVGHAIYTKHRPTIVGRYFPPYVLQERCDPHLQTADGIDYSFMGLGVYTLFITNDTNPVKLQASMRRLGNGTVFSGFATNCQNTLLEAYLDQEGNFTFAINGLRMEDYQLNYILMNDIEVTRNDDRTTNKFKFMTVNLIIDVVITGNILNLFISPPDEYKGKLNGLLGFYDGNSTNDFTTSDGVTLPPDADPLTIHNQFGNSWKEEEVDWLFSKLIHINNIKQDLQTGGTLEPVYEYKFPSDEELQEVQVMCNFSESCILDVFLAGRQMADVYANLSQKIASSQLSLDIRLFINFAESQALNVTNTTTAQTITSRINQTTAPQTLALDSVDNSRPATVLIPTEVRNDSESSATTAVTHGNPATTEKSDAGVAGSTEDTNPGTGTPRVEDSSTAGVFPNQGSTEEIIAGMISTKGGMTEQNAGITVAATPGFQGALTQSPQAATTYLPNTGTTAETEQSSSPRFPSNLGTTNGEKGATTISIPHYTVLDEFKTGSPMAGNSGEGTTSATMTAEENKDVPTSTSKDDKAWLIPVLTILLIVALIGVVLAVINYKFRFITFSQARPSSDIYTSSTTYPAKTPSSMQSQPEELTETVHSDDGKVHDENTEDGKSADGLSEDAISENGRIEDESSQQVVNIPGQPEGLEEIIPGNI